MKIADPPGPARPNLLIYGPPKTGKTALACSSGLPTLLLNCDLPNAARYARSKKRDPTGKVMEVVVPNFVEGSRTTPVLDLMGELVESVMEPKDDTPAVVVADPIGELYRRLLEEFSNRSLRPTWDHRLMVTTQIERFARTLCELPHVSAIFVCHDMAQQQGETLEFFPQVGSKSASTTGLGPKLLGMVDVIAYTGIAVQEDNTKSYLAQVVQEEGRRGGDRYDCLDDGSGFREQSLADWFAVIEASEQAESTLTPPPSTNGGETAKTKKAAAAA